MRHSSSLLQQDDSIQTPASLARLHYSLSCCTVSTQTRTYISGSEASTYELSVLVFVKVLNIQLYGNFPLNSFSEIHLSSFFQLSRSSNLWMNGYSVIDYNTSLGKKWIFIDICITRYILLHYFKPRGLIYFSNLIQFFMVLWFHGLIKVSHTSSGKEVGVFANFLKDGKFFEIYYLS